MGNSVCELKKPCTGCGACTIICPVGALSINKNEEGFFSAVIDSEKCVSCGKCVNVCLKNGVSKAKELTEGEVFAAQSNDPNVVKGSSSGGIAHEMSRYAVNNGYIVIGSVYDSSQNIVKAVLAENEDELLRFRGSKYLQGKCDDAFRQAIEIANKDEEKRFLVFGTPCQIYGLASLLEEHKIRDRFILVDLFCHGVPSYLVWESYLSSIRSKIGEGKIKSLAFRDKSIGWHNFVMCVEGEQRVYRETSEGDLFFKAFFDNVLLSDACFDCEVRKKFSKADIRLGDFWGKRFQGREDGVSAVLCLNEKGKAFIDELSGISIIKSVEVSEVLSGQSVHTYRNEKKLHKDAIGMLGNTGNLNKTISNYRKNFPLKRRTKLFIKESTAVLPDGIRAVIRKIYKKL